MLLSLVFALSALAQTGQPVVVMADSPLRLACLAGSLLGSLATLGLAQSEDTLRGITLKCLTALVSSIAFAPSLLRYFELVPDVDIVLGMSAGVAIVSTVTLQAGLTYYQRWLANKLSSLEK